MRWRQPLQEAVVVNGRRAIPLPLRPVVELLANGVVKLLFFVNEIATK
jgi:hypothetical protein